MLRRPDGGGDRTAASAAVGLRLAAAFDGLDGSRKAPELGARSRGLGARAHMSCGRLVQIDEGALLLDVLDASLGRNRAPR